MAATHILSTQGLSKNFGGLKVVEDLTLNVVQGRTTAVIGPNGAGKTTVFNLISGVYQPSSGAVHIDGIDVTQLPSRKRVHAGLARSFQNIRLMSHLTVYENLLVGQHAGLSGNAIVNLFQPFRLQRRHKWHDAAMDALEEYGLADRAHETVDNLPYGLRKRIDLVRAVLSAPKVLLLDEPAAGLNPAETTQLLAHLEIIRRKGTDLVVIEHDMSFIRRLCEHVVVLNFGQKIAEGSLSEVQNDEAVREAYLGKETKG